MITAIPRRMRSLSIVSCLILAFSLGLPQRALGQAQNEYLLRAAYVFNLAKYVDWPSSANRMTVCFVGEGPMGAALKKVLDGKTIGPRIMNVSLQPPDETLGACQVVYVGRVSSRKLQDLLGHLRSQPSLAIGENELFVHEGGGVALVRVSDQFQIQINVGVVEAAGLKLSSRLLNLSSVVCVDRKR